MPGPHDGLAVAGDSTYAPLELMYREVSRDPKTRRFGCDMFHLGGRAVFLFARVQITALVVENLSTEHRRFNGAGPTRRYCRSSKRHSTWRCCKFAEHVPPYLRDDMQRIVAELCNPDPSRRGHPENRGAGQFSLERYITLFDRLAGAPRMNGAHNWDCSECLSSQGSGTPGRAALACVCIPAADFGEVAHAGGPTRRRSSNGGMLGPLLEDWRREPGLSVAADLVSTAFSIGQSDSTEAAEFVLGHRAATPAAREIDGEMPSGGRLGAKPTIHQELRARGSIGNAGRHPPRPGAVGRISD